MPLQERSSRPFLIGIYQGFDNTSGICEDYIHDSHPLGFNENSTKKITRLKFVKLGGFIFVKAQQFSLCFLELCKGHHKQKHRVPGLLLWVIGLFGCVILASGRYDMH